LSSDSGLLSIACDRIADLAVPACIKDSLLRYVAVNAAYARFFGRDIGDFAGHTTGALFSSAHDFGREDKERRALVFGDEESTRLVAADGRDYCPLRVERFVDEDDSLYLFGFGDALVENALDSTSRAAHSMSVSAPVQAAISNHELFRMALEDLPVATFVRDQGHRLIFANDAYFQITGLTAEALVGKTEIEAYPQHGHILHRTNAAIFERGGTVESEEVLVCANGDLIRVIARTSRVETSNGARYLVGSITDVSEMASREEQLVEAGLRAEAINRQLDALLRSLPVGILILNTENIIEYANDAFYEIQAVGEPLDVTGWSLRDFIVYNYNSGRYPKTDLTVDDIYQLRLKQLYSETGAAAQQLVTPIGRTLAITSARMDEKKILVTYSDITALQQHEQKSNLYHAALEQLTTPFFLRDDEARMTFANAAYQQLVGRTSAQLVGTTADDIYLPQGAERHDTNLAVLAGDAPTERSETFTTSAGIQLPVITRVHRIVTPDGKRFLAGSISDVSLLKAREEQLIAAQARAEALFADLDGIMRTMPVGIVILDRSMRIEFANAMIYAIWNWPTDVLMNGISFREYMEINHGRGITWRAGEFEENYTKRIEEIRAVSDTMQSELLTQDGRMVMVTTKRLADDRILLTYSDITEIRQQQQQIGEARAALERLGGIMQDASGAMAQGLLVIENGIITLSNPSMAQILDIPAELFSAGRNWRECFAYAAARGDYGDNPAETLNAWQHNVAIGENFTTTFLSAGRTWVKMDATASGNGYWTVVCTDVTDAKLREEELTRLLARSEAADRAKSEFLANMSHEIRTPMNGVLGMAELLTKSALDTRQKTFVDIIVKSGNALMTIINDILDFSKIDAGQLQLRKAAFDPVEAIEDVATLLSMSAAQKDIELIVRGDASVRHMVLGDPGRFRQIVTNLVGNAIKFTEKGHVLIDLSTESMECGQMMLSLRVEDTGIGIPEAKRLSIFDKFSQVDTSSTRRHEGTGLGLAITAGLVELFGGYIEVESEVGRGSVFTTHLPFSMASERSRQNAVPVSVQDARVLVIDDNAINRTILTEQLALWGFDGVAVESGTAGLQILKEAAQLGVVIDALVIDYQMPEMNGIDVARAIRSDRCFDDIGIVFLTSMDMVGDETIFQQLNVQAHLMKPARANLLRNAIIDVVRAGRLQARGVPINRRPTAAAPQNRRSDPGHAPRPATAATPGVEPMFVAADLGGRGSEKMSGRHYDVLVAEDNEVNQIVFSQILQSAGLTFLIAGDGREAVEAWQRHGPGMILMDVSMPVMNGHQAARTIREKEREAGDGRHVPIVGVTAHALISDRELCIDAGMDDYMSKPISPELLEQKIDQWLDIRATFLRGGGGE